MSLPQSEVEEKMVLDSVARSRPVGSDSWMQRMAKASDMGPILRSRGRPVVAEIAQTGDKIRIMPYGTFYSHECCGACGRLRDLLAFCLD